MPFSFFLCNLPFCKVPLDSKIFFLGLKSKHIKHFLSLGKRMEG